MLIKAIELIKARNTKIKLYKIQTRGGCVWNKKYHFITFMDRRLINTVFIEYRKHYSRMSISAVYQVMQKFCMV